MLEIRDLPDGPDADRRAEAVERLTARRIATRFVQPEDARTQAVQTLERVAQSSTWADVLDAGQPVGWLWLGGEGEELVVYDVVLDYPARTEDLLPHLVERARQQQARMLAIGSGPGEPIRQALAALPGFTVRATNMALGLDGVIADPAPLALRPMSQAEFEVWIDGEVDGYAEELAATGLSPERALERSRTQMAELIPAGLESSGMEFFMAWVGEDVVGDLWLHTAETLAFVYDIQVDEAHRRRGYGAAIMNAAARHCREGGHPYVGLNVFGHNPHARALYDKLGYRVTFDYSALDLPDAG